MMQIGNNKIFFSPEKTSFLMFKYEYYHCNTKE